MKKVVLLLISATLIVACTEDDCTSSSTKQLVPIVATGSIVHDINKSKAPVNSTASNLPLSTLGLYFVRTNDAVTADWTTVTGSQTASVGNAQGVFSGNVSPTGIITFGTSEYYNANPSLNSYLLAYYPASNANYPSASNPGILQWTLDGKSDVLISSVASGNRNSSTPLAFTANHQLCWIQFYVQAASGTGAEIANIWGNVTGISILNQSNTLTLTLPSTKAFSGSTTINTVNTSDATPSPLAIPPYNSAAFFSQAMVQPATYNAGISGNYQIIITTSNGGSEIIPISLTGNAATVAGNRHTVTLTFGKSTITATATVIAWINGAGGTGNP